MFSPVTLLRVSGVINESGLIVKGDRMLGNLSLPFSDSI